MSKIYICNVPFCGNERNYNHGYCSKHRWEREKCKTKAYKEVLPIWCTKKCKIHGYLRPSESYFHHTNKNYICRQCAIDKQPEYDPIKTKAYNEKYSERRKDRRLKKRYKISIHEYNELLLKQNNCCAICKITIEEHKKRKGSDHTFAVDHCHITNKIRALLCFKCNMGLGYFNDSIELILLVLDYLRSH